jgi:HSP20 family molecular chaperone IbpA
MPQEPRSFFQRLTGARLMPGSQDDYAADETTEGVPLEESYNPEEAEVIEEPVRDEEEGYGEESRSDAGGEEQEGQLTVDVFQDDQSIVIQSTIAGVSPDDLDVSITNDMVTIRGDRRRMYEVDPEDYFYQECYWGPFSRSIILPVEIDADRAEAKIKNGVLSIRIPKANAAMTRKLRVKAT